LRPQGFEIQDGRRQIALSAIWLVIGLITVACGLPNLLNQDTVFKGEFLTDEQQTVFEVLKNQVEITVPADGGPIEGTFILSLIARDNTVYCAGDILYYTGTLVGSFDEETKEMNGRGFDGVGSAIDAGGDNCGSSTEETGLPITWVAEYDEVSGKLVGMIEHNGGNLLVFSVTDNEEN